MKTNRKILGVLLGIAVFLVILFYYSNFVVMKIRQRTPDIVLTDNIEFSHDGELLTASTSRYTYLWRVIDGKILKVIPNLHFFLMSASHISPNGRYLSNYGPSFTLYDIFEDRTIFEAYDYDDIKSFESTGRFSPDSRYVMLDYFSYVDIENRTIIRDQELREQFDYQLCITKPLKKQIKGQCMAVFHALPLKPKGLNITKDSSFSKISLSLYNPVSQTITQQKDMPWTSQYIAVKSNYFGSYDRNISFKGRVFTGGSKVFLLNDSFMYIKDMENAEKKIVPVKNNNKHKRMKGMIPWVSFDGNHFAIAYNYENSAEIIIYESASGKIVSTISLPKDIIVFYYTLDLSKQIAAIGFNNRNNVYEGIIHIYSLETKQRIRVLLKGGNIHAYP